VADDLDQFGMSLLCQFKGQLAFLVFLGIEADLDQGVMLQGGFHIGQDGVDALLADAHHGFEFLGLAAEVSAFQSGLGVLGHRGQNIAINAREST